MDSKLWNIPAACTIQTVESSSKSRGRKYENDRESSFIVDSECLRFWTQVEWPPPLFEWSARRDFRVIRMLSTALLCRRFYDIISDCFARSAIEQVPEEQAPLAFHGGVNTSSVPPTEFPLI